MKATINQALQASSKILMADFGIVKEIKNKEDQSNVVTKTDLASEKAIVEIIEKAYPEHNIIAEETSYKNKGSEYTWIIDPIDGTSNFSVDIPWFGTLIAVLKDWKPIIAGASIPFYNHFYFAEKGKGAFLNDQKITISSETNLKNILAAYSLDYKEDFSETKKESEAISNLVNNVRNIRSTNSLLDFLYTAEGKFGACINQTTKIWDLAAPSLIIEEAGGIVTDINGNKLDFKVSDKDYQKNYTIVAANKKLHPQIMKIII